MSKPYDATLKDLLELGAASWPILAGLPPAPTTVIDADTSTVSGGADKVLYVAEAEPCLLHVEFQRGPDRTLPQRMHLDNAILADCHRLPVVSVAVLLSPKANLRAINGEYERSYAGELYLRFRYRVIRIWQLPTKTLLEGDIGLVPLAPISDVHPDQLPGVVARMMERLGSGEGRDVARFWTATYVLMGLKYPRSITNHLLEGVVAMEESVTYQAIIEKGEIRGARKVFLNLAEMRLGEPPAEAIEALNSVTRLKKIAELHVLLPSLKSWNGLLEYLASQRPRRRRHS